MLLLTILNIKTISLQSKPISRLLANDAFTTIEASIDRLAISYWVDSIFPSLQLVGPAYLQFATMIYVYMQDIV